MVCPKCGEKNNEKSKFCNKCGENLKKTSNNNKKKVLVDTKELKSNIIDLIKELIIKPINTFKTYGEEKNFSLAIALVIALSLINGLFVLMLLKRTHSLIENSIGSLENLYSYSDYQTNISYTQSFFLVTIITFVLSFAYVGILHLVNTKMFKVKESFKKTYTIYGLISIVASITLLLSTIVLFISFSFTSIIFSLGIALTEYYTYHMIKMIGPKDKNKHGYIYATSIGIICFLIIITIRIYTKI